MKSIEHLSYCTTGFPLVLLLLNTAEAPRKQVACGSSEQLSYCRVGFSVFLLETAGMLGKQLA